MRLKVCGMCNAENINELLEVGPDYMGFIFYENSKRFADGKLDENLLKSFPHSTKKVGVFVNASQAYILEQVKKYNLDYVQLHGEELPDFCRNLKFKGINIIKAFSVDNDFNFAKLNNYKPFCDFFLFDTKGTQHGGNGISFDWSVLRKYDQEKPFFLAGGIDLANAHEAMELTGMRIHALDVNSKFEFELDSTGTPLKNIDKISELMKILKPEQAILA